MFGYNADAIVTPCEPGVVRRVLSWSDEMMMCEISFEKGAKGNFHHHPHEQITYVAEGSFSFTIDGEGHLLWQDAKEDAGKDMHFEWMNRVDVDL